MKFKFFSNNGQKTESAIYLYAQFNFHIFLKQWLNSTIICVKISESFFTIIHRLWTFFKICVFELNLNFMEFFMQQSVYIFESSWVSEFSSFSILAKIKNYSFNTFRPPLQKNRDFSRTHPLLVLRPVCKFKFVSFGPEEKKPRGLCISWFNRRGPMKFENTFFQIAN